MIADGQHIDRAFDTIALQGFYQDHNLFVSSFPLDLLDHAFSFDFSKHSSCFLWWF
ncbi:MAG: hypothetical protein HC892_15245 [Saprospiraceae bacterium]|nr:hypothetical protein [Saprospiraceae bacterium]